MPIIVFFAPVLLMVIAIRAISPLLPITDVTIRSRVIWGVSLFLLGIVVLVALMQYYDICSIYDVSFVILLCGPTLLVGIAGFFLQYALRDPCLVRWRYIAVSLALLAVGCFLLGTIASFGRLWPFWAFLIALSCVSVALVTAIWIAWSLRRWRKLIALLVVFVLPAVFWASVLTGDTQSPEGITEKNGDMIVQALEQYHDANGMYPTHLAELVPVHLSELPEALTTQGTGWLYTSDARKYTLGYWHYPHKLGVILCLHDSETTEWQCESTVYAQGWEPFSPVLTPIPTPGP
jgi:hypothetical protein